MKNLSIYSFYLFVLILMPINIFAQEATGIEEVIVTATKTESNVQDIPMVVDVFTESQINDLNINTTEDIGNLIPSLTVAYNVDPMNARMSIRGIGTSQSDASLESDVSFVVDGVYLNKTGLGLNDLVDIERIEVLQGPQGTLYGKNSNAGVVNITTKKPTPGDADAFIKYENGDYNKSSVSSAMTFGISDSIALRLTANTTESDGWMTNSVDGSSANGDDNQTLAIKLYFEEDDLKVFFNHTDISKKSTCCAVDSIDTSNQTAAANAMGALGAFGAYAPADGRYDNYRFQARPGMPTFNLDSTLTSMRVDKETENGVLTYVLARNDYTVDRKWDADFSAAEFWNLHRILPGDSLTNELRFSSNMIGNLQYTVGVYISESTYGEYGGGEAMRAITIGEDLIPIYTQMVSSITDSITAIRTAQSMGLATAAQLGMLPALGAQAAALGGLVATTAQGDGAAQDMTWDDSTSAIFGRVTNHFSDTTRVILGLRYTDEEKEADLYANTVLDGTMTVSAAMATAFDRPELAGVTAPRQTLLNDTHFLTGVLQNVDQIFTRGDTAITWSLSMEKDLRDDIMLYVSAATGYKSGGFNSTSGLDNLSRAFDKTETESFELGIKSRLFDNRVQLNAAIFSAETEGQHYITQAASGGGTIVGNATVPAERLGFDMNLVAKISPSLTLNASFYTIDDNEPDIASNAAARLTPNDAYTVGLSHQYPLAGGMVFTRLNYTYDGPYEWTSAYVGSPAFPAVPGYPEFLQDRDQKNVNAKIGWRNDSWEIAYSVKNATDETTPRLALNPSPVSGVNGITMFNPKLSSISIKYNF